MQPLQRGVFMRRWRTGPKTSLIARIFAWFESMASATSKRPSRRRRLIARRPHPDLEFFFRRYERRRPGMNRPDEGARPDGPELPNQMRLQNRH
jgi:hypothetical protein